MYLLDTSFLIDCYDENPIFLKKLSELSSTKIYISIISVAEIFSSVEEAHIEYIQNFLSSFTLLPLTLEIAIKAGLTRFKLKKKGYKKALPDVLIAQTALENNLILVTANPKDFPQLEEKRLLLPFPD